MIHGLLPVRQRLTCMMSSSLYGAMSELAPPPLNQVDKSVCGLYLETQKLTDFLVEIQNLSG